MFFYTIYNVSLSCDLVGFKWCKLYHDNFIPVRPTLQIMLVKICQHLPNVGSNINSLNCLVNLTQRWTKLNQTLGNNLPNNSSKKCELDKFYATLVKMLPNNLDCWYLTQSWVKPSQQATDLCIERVTIWNHFLKIQGDYLKNHWTNTRLVCTHLDAFSMLNPSIAMKHLVLTNFEKKNVKFWPVICTRHKEG